MCSSCSDRIGGGVVVVVVQQWTLSTRGPPRRVLCQSARDADLCVCVSVADGARHDGTAVGRGRRAGLGSAQVRDPLRVHGLQQLCGHPVLLLVPSAPPAAQNMGQLRFLAHRRNHVQVAAGHGVLVGLDRRLHR